MQIAIITPSECCPCLLLTFYKLKVLKSKKMLLAFSVVQIATTSFSQDARLTQVQDMPMLVNPAQIGNFNGSIRATAHYGSMSDGSSQNSYMNVGADFRFKKSGFAFGLNYLGSGSTGFPVNNQAMTIGVSQSWRLDKDGAHTLAAGFQAGVISSTYDTSITPYNELLDIRNYRFTSSKQVIDPTKRQDDIVVHIGGRYGYKWDKGRFQTGIALYNFSNLPNVLAYEDAKDSKRMRATIFTIFETQLSSHSRMQLKYLAWKEGIFRKGYNPAKEPLIIEETIFGMEWQRTAGTPVSMGLMTRSWKSVAVEAGLGLTPSLRVRASYEYPFVSKIYYNVQQAGIGITYIPQNRSGK
jgi:hypothetical protein